MYRDSGIFVLCGEKGMCTFLTKTVRRRTIKSVTYLLIFMSIVHLATFRRSLNIEVTNKMAYRIFTGAEVEGESRCNHEVMDSNNGHVQKADENLPKATTSGIFICFLIFQCKYAL